MTDEMLGEKPINVGWTIGEEILFDKAQFYVKYFDDEANPPTSLNPYPDIPSLRHQQLICYEHPDDQRGVPRRERRVGERIRR